MKKIKPHLVFAFLLFASVAAAIETPSGKADEGESGGISESRCREMNESMLQLMKSTPLNKPRDVERNEELIAKVEKMLADNRREGVDECRSWMDFSRIIVHQ